MRTIILILSIFILIGLLGCTTDGPLQPPFGKRFTWVAIDPIQCMGNPWEIEWLEEHDWDYSSYPRELKDRLPIIVDYYKWQGIKIYCSMAMWTYSATCDACGCPAGYTVYFSVSNRDVPKVLKMGFRIESPGYCRIAK